MKSPVKVAVIGAGALGEHHARIYHESPDAELVAIVDLKEDRARQIAGLYSCPAYSNFSQILNHVEAASVAVPTILHSPVGTELLERGIHVLVEKPIAHDIEGAEQLILAAKRGGAILHVGHSERFNPAVTAVRSLISRPRFFEAHRLGVFVPRSLDIDVVLDLMIHDLDLILHLVSEPVREIRAVGIPILTPRIDIANARLEFENGCVANVTASRVSAEKIRKLRLFQPHDYISIDFQQQDAEVFSLLAGEDSRKIIKRDLQVQRCEPLRLEIETFLQTVRGQETGLAGCTGTEGKKVLELALQVLEQMERGSQ